MRVFAVVLFCACLLPALFSPLTGCRLSADTGRDSNLAPTPDNKNLQADVTSKLADISRYQHINVSDVQAECESGYIVLRGQVQSAADRDEIRMSLERLVGVRGVNVSGLRVAPSGKPTK